MGYIVDRVSTWLPIMANNGRTASTLKKMRKVPYWRWHRMGSIDEDQIATVSDAHARITQALALLIHPLMNTVTGIGEIRGAVVDALNAVNRLLN